MKPLILLVDNDPKFLEITKTVLEFNEAKVLTAKNGKEGLKILAELKKAPDIIISEIMMPEMNGYDFFEAVSNDPNFSHLPFIFLSELDSPEEIRMGKMLGVDDYLTKPVNDDDLLAIVAGKVKRKLQNELFDIKIKEKFTSKKEGKLLDSKEQRDFLLVIEVNWDDRLGPNLVDHFPKDILLDFPLSHVAGQLYATISSIYGQERITKAESLLLKVKNFNIMAYVFFDSYPDETYRGGNKDYMFSVIAPKITYFQSLQIKPVFKEISSLYKKIKSWDIEAFWYRFSDIFTQEANSINLE